MRIAIYTRVSSEEQVNNGYSLEAQKEKMESFVASQNDYELSVDHYFTDEGVSGVKPIDQRPGLKALFEAAKRKEFDIVLVYKIDRFFRKTRLLLEAVENLAEYNIGLKSITETFDTSNSMGRFMLSTLGSVAELERENIMERMALGRVKAAEKGTWIGGGVAFGYKLLKEIKRLEIVEEEAEVVRLIFKLLLEGNNTAYEVQTKLNEMGIPTKFDRIGREKGSKTKNWWNKRTITRILTNTVYTGKFEYKRKYVPQRSEYQENLRPKDEIVVQSVPKIIEQEVFSKAQEILKKNKERSLRNTQRPYLFNQLITCGECGKCWTARTRDVELKGGGMNYHKYYRCVSTLSGCNPYTCNQRQLREDVFENALWPELVKLLTKPELVYPEIESRIKNKFNIEETRKLLATTESLLVKDREKLNRLNELYVEGVLDKNNYLEKKSALQSKIERFEVDLVSLKSECKALPGVGEFKAMANRVYSQLFDRLNSLKYEDKAFVIRQVVSKVRYAFGEATVTVLLRDGQLWERQRMG